MKTANSIERKPLLHKFKTVNLVMVRLLADGTKKAKPFGNQRLFFSYIIVHNNPHLLMSKRTTKSSLIVLFFAAQYTLPNIMEK